MWPFILSGASELIPYCLGFLSYREKTKRNLQHTLLQKYKDYACDVITTVCQLTFQHGNSTKNVSRNKLYASSQCCCVASFDLVNRSESAPVLLWRGWTNMSKLQSLDYLTCFHSVKLISSLLPFSVDFRNDQWDFRSYRK